jgi:signal recognition particle subunit SEC65
MYRLRFNQYIGEGDFATIYRVSNRRILKVFDRTNNFNNEEIDLLINDEIRGGTLNYGLPVIKEMVVLCPICCDECSDYKEVRALLKRFIPFTVTEEECCEIINRSDFPIELKWDSNNPRQMRKDEKGRIYVVDTQTEKIMHLVRRKY